MNKGRLEAFSDGVLAIIITIMVLEFVPQQESDFAALRPLIPKFLSYVLSFIFLGIYWNNHHHLWQAVERVGGSVLWANLHLLFWLSLIPFVTSWMGETHFSTIPVVLYGLVLWLAATAYYFMIRTLMAFHPKDSTLAAAIGNGAEGADLPHHLHCQNGSVVSLSLRGYNRPVGHRGDYNLKRSGG